MIPVLTGNRGVSVVRLTAEQAIQSDRDGELGTLSGGAVSYRKGDWLVADDPIERVGGKPVIRVVTGEAFALNYEVRPQQPAPPVPENTDPLKGKKSKESPKVVDGPSTTSNVGPQNPMNDLADD